MLAFGRSDLKGHDTDWLDRPGLPSAGFYKHTRLGLIREAW